MSEYKTNWYQTIYFFSTSAEITHYKKLWTEVQNLLGDMSPSDGNVEIFKRGLECLYEELRNGEDMSPVIEARKKIRELAISLFPWS